MVVPRKEAVAVEANHKAIHDRQPAAGKKQQQQMPTVLLLRPLFPPFEDALSKKFRFLKPWEEEDITPRDAFLAAHAESVRVILCSGPTPIDADIIARLPRLECIVATSAGVNHIDMAACRRRGIAVANAGPAFAEDAADYAVGLLIDVFLRVSAIDRRVRAGAWPVDARYALGSRLRGKRVGIVGLGRIGSEVAKRLQAFGCIISYNARSKKPSLPYAFFAEATAMARKSDVLVVTCQLNSETRHIVNREVLLALGRRGVVINVGRGALVDEAELVRCLKEGEIAGAGLDVFENEPTVPEELLAMDNVVLSPHRAIFTPEALSDLLDLTAANLEAAFSNKPLPSPVS